MKPLVSILIPAYNAEGCISETLTSAFAQTWPRTEIIVVDDGSTDETLAVAKHVAARRTNVKVVTQDHRGAPAARNHALTLSQGDCIQWLDADDLLAPDKIERQMQRWLESPGSRLVMSSAWGQFIHCPTRARFVPISLWQDLSPLEWLIRKMAHNVFMQTGTWLVSRELTVAAGPWDQSLAVDDDGEYFCRVLLKSEGVRFVPEARVFYRMSGFTRLSLIGQSREKMDSQFRSMQLHISYLRSLADTERTRSACVQYLQNCLGIFHPERPDIVNQSQRLAEDLGGRLDLPRLPRKYAVIGGLFGGPAAKRAQAALPRIRWSVTKFWDKMLARFA
jgi:glycosyltransferase involved in cell wall biosynthesis